MSGPSGMAIDPTLLWQQQNRAAAAAAAASGQQPQQEAGAAVKQEDQPDTRAGTEQEDETGAMQEDASAAPPLPAAANGAAVSPEDPDTKIASTTQPTPPAIDLRDDAELAAFLAKMEDYEPILPDSVTRFYLEKAGFQSADDRV